MLDSVANVEAAGMVAVGVGADEADASRPRIVEVAGWRVAVLGFGGVVPETSWHAAGERPGQATGYDADRMAAAVAAAAAVADLVVVTVHWGTERALEPRPEDVVKARAMIAAGADVVFGHHVHRLQPLELVADVPVFWNLGNFVWPRLSPESATTAVAAWVVEPDGTVSACLLPFEVDGLGVPRPTGASPTCR
jgi:poly-gamma-glutamate capsule biosynthesis protein CapA/YwtB (metallophosphatase superfamily)